MSARSRRRAREDEDDDDYQQQAYDMSRWMPTTPPISTLPLGDATEAVLDRVSCADAARLARSGRVGAQVAQSALDVCGSLDDALEVAISDLSAYCDIFFAHVVRMIPNGRVKHYYVDVRGAHDDDVRWIVKAKWSDGCRCVEISSGEGNFSGVPVVFRLIPEELPEVRQQVNAVVDVLRARQQSDVPSIGFELSDALLQQYERMSLVRVSRRISRRFDDMPKSLVKALRNDELAPADLVRALAQAIMLSSNLNATATTGIERLSNATSSATAYDDKRIDVDAVFRACGVDPASLTWITSAAAFFAHPDVRRSYTMPIAETKRLLDDLGIAWRRRGERQQRSSSARLFAAAAARRRRS